MFFAGLAATVETSSFRAFTAKTFQFTPKRLPRSMQGDVDGVKCRALFFSNFGRRTAFEIDGLNEFRVAWIERFNSRNNTGAEGEHLVGVGVGEVFAYSLHIGVQSFSPAVLCGALAIVIDDRMAEQAVEPCDQIFIRPNLSDMVKCSCQTHLQQVLRIDLTADPPSQESQPLGTLCCQTGETLIGSSSRRDWLFHSGSRTSSRFNAYTPVIPRQFLSPQLVRRARRAERGVADRIQRTRGQPPQYFVEYLWRQSLRRVDPPKDNLRERPG